MRKNLVTFLAVLMVVGLIGYASQATASQPTKTAAPPTAPTATPAPVHHGHEIKGSITAYDEAAKMLKLKDAAGKEHEFSLTTATVIKGTAAVGVNATVRYMIKSGKNVATSIRIAAPAPAPAPAAAPVKK